MRRLIPWQLYLPLSLFLALGCASTGAVPSPAPLPGDGEWDVAQPPGDSREVEIDTREGTWVSVDVSPDGETVVFDLLGDLYTVPMAGGDATALTSGGAWDMQPRFSPDGRWVAFTSDRSGGNNLWVISAAGGEATAVSRETFRLVNSPAWTPDSQFIAGRKHFTSRRSLGAGEIWLYHRSGGGGLQMTARPNDQKDLGEPAFSPDGRYLYYSQDVTPGPIFEYNKDSNTQIYVVQRLDRESGEVEAFVTGPGGSIRPTPSPDGRSLAFVRRVRGQSVLYVQDLESGAERTLFDGLDRDMQEIWAIHGVYPAMAWTPDSREIVFWAAGRIWRIGVGGGDPVEVPFRVRDHRRVFEVPRYAQEVAPERFDVKLLRWVQVSPDGDQVLYQALGHLWIKDLPDGEPRRLTRQEEHFEFYPSFSRDGRWVVYVSWSDDELGAVRVASAQGGEGRPLTSEPGHYVEPVFSPSGATVVYRKVGGGRLRTPTWSRDPGIYRISAEGGTPRLLSSQGLHPSFGAAGDRVFFTRFEGGGQRTLRSVAMDGSEPREHATSGAATEMVVSPDGRWLAFRERFKAYLIPFPATGKSLEVSPKMRSLPLVKVGEEAGEYLHFSGDSSRLYWSVGPTLHQRSLADAFDFLEALEPSGEATSHGEAGAGPIAIGFTAATARPEGQIALVGARLITMRGEEVIEDGTVLVDGDRIAAVGPTAEIEVPAGARRIDAQGLTVMPGLIDVHAHGPQSSDGMQPQRNWLHYATLAFGVTTVHDPSNGTASIFSSSELARAGLITAPRIFSTGTILYGADGDARAEVDSLADARFHLGRMKAVGAFSVKSYNQPRRDQRQQILAAARELELMVVAEGGATFHTNMTMVADGHTGIEHNLPVERIYDDVKQLWGASETGNTPTLVVAFGGVEGENYFYQHDEVWKNERLLTFVPRQRIDARSRRRVGIPESELNHIQAAKVVADLRDAGVGIQLGGHGQREGLAAHWELWMFVQGGMTPHQALRAATLAGAEYLGLDGDLGSLETGKLADLIVLEADPLEEIRNSESIRYTMVGGRLYDARTMDQVAPQRQLRGRFFWETQVPK